MWLAKVKVQRLAKGTPLLKFYRRKLLLFKPQFIGCSPILQTSRFDKTMHANTRKQCQCRQWLGV